MSEGVEDKKNDTFLTGEMNKMERKHEKYLGVGECAGGRSHDSQVLEGNIV